MLGLVRRTELEKAEGQTRMVLAHFMEAVATAQKIHEQFEAMLATCRDWQRLYEEQAAELKKARDARDLAHWVIRIPGTENIGPPTLIGEYVEGGH